MCAVTGHPCLWEPHQKGAAASYFCILSSVGYNPLFSFSRWLARIKQGHINEQFLEISTTQEDGKKGRKEQTSVCRSRIIYYASGKDTVTNAFKWLILWLLGDWSHFKSEHELC